MKLKIKTAMTIITDSDGSIPVVCCGLNQKAFHTACIDGNSNDLENCTVIKHVNSKTKMKWNILAFSSMILHCINPNL